MQLDNPYSDLSPLPPAYLNDSRDPASWPEAPSATARRGQGYDGLGSTGDTMASLPDVKTWHGNEKQLDPTTPATVARTSGLDWSAGARALGALINGAQVRIPGSAIVREDTGAVLGVVGPDYSVLQPSVVVDTAHALAEDLGTVIGAAGSFSGGRDVWCLIRGKYDPNGPMGPGSMHLLLHTGMDGTSAFTLVPTHVLVCCQNTLALALASRDGLKLRHVGPIADRVRYLGESAVQGLEHARKVLTLIEESDTLSDLREDELGDFVCWSMRGSLSSEQARAQFQRAASARENMLQGRSSVAKVVQVATYVGSHGSRSTARSLYLGAHRAAVNGMVSRLVGLDTAQGRTTVAEFRRALEIAE